MNILQKIPKEKKLVIFDMFGTLIYNGGPNVYKPKIGIDELLGKLYSENKILAVSSDAPREDDDIKLTFELSKDSYKNWSIYFKNNIYQGWGHIVDYNKSTAVKNLGQILKDCNVTSNKDAIFIGDNGLERDIKSAEAFGIDFILVNQETDMSKLF